MLKVTNLSTELLTISLTVETNQIVAITGNNGSGKSTLAKTIAGYYQYNSGEINVDYNQIGLLTQNPYLQFIGNTVFDELTYSLEQQGKDLKLISEILDNCPFELDRNLATLSGGQAQRLLIYKEMRSNKQVLILDETLSNLDEDSKMEIIGELKTSNKAVILITNNLNDTRFADSVYHLADGSLSLTTDKFTTEQLEANDNPVTIDYDGNQFKAGLNLVTGTSSSGKTTLITKLCFDLKTGISLIPQYPFEIVTTLDASHLYQRSEARDLYMDQSKFNQNITELSTGELVKVLILEAIESGNKILVLDESIEVLDAKSQTAAIDLIESHFETIIIVTHNKYLFNNRKVNVVEVKWNQ